jgi:hypothetical protein
MLLLPNTNFLANTLGILDHSTGIIADMRTRSVSENVHALTDFVAQFLVGSPDRVLFFVALVVEVLVTLLAYVLALFGIVTGWKQHRATIVLLLVMIGDYLVVTGPIGTGRYRLPAMPYVMILSGSGWVQLRSWCRIRRSPDPGPAKTAA